MGDQVVDVTCYSGETYAERPLNVLWQGNQLSVIKILREQLCPGYKSFDVILDNGWKVELQYHFGDDLWKALGFPDTSQKHGKE
jgi:hypothetical protein